MLTELHATPAANTESAPYGVGCVTSIAGVAGVAVRSAGIYRRFEPAVAA